MKKLHKIAALTSSAFILAQASLMTLTLNTPLVQVQAAPPQAPPGGVGGFGGSGTVNQGTTATELTEDGTVTDSQYSSTGDDENALRVTNAKVTLTGIKVDKTAGATSNTEDGDFYGMVPP